VLTATDKRLPPSLPVPTRSAFPERIAIKIADTIIAGKG
jgi:hypothetical protein